MNNEEIIKEGQSKKVLSGGNVFYEPIFSILGWMLNEARVDERKKILNDYKKIIIVDKKEIETQVFMKDIEKIFEDDNAEITINVKLFKEIINDNENKEILFSETKNRIVFMLEEMEKRADFLYNDTVDLANKKYERGFFDGIHNTKEKIKEMKEV